MEKTRAVIFPTKAAFPALACPHVPGRVTSALQNLLGKGRDFSCLSPAGAAKLEQLAISFCRTPAPSTVMPW